MRVLVAAHPYVGHLRIPVQLATYLAREGHTVAIVTGTGHEAARAVVPWDLPTFAVDGGLDAARFAGTVPADVARGEVEAVASILLGDRPHGMLADLDRVVAQFRPDVVLRDCTYVLAALAAARAGVPEVSLIGIPEATTRAARRAFTSVQRRAGLPGVGDVVSSVRNISFLPDAFYDDELPAVVHRRVEFDPGSIRTDPEEPAAPGEVAPTVLATFGTVSYPIKAIIKVARALGELGVPSVLAVGSLRPWFRDRPRSVAGHVRIVGLVDQARVLPGCRLFITHAGFNSVREAVSCGCPMLVAPQLGEQLQNARRCCRLGIARQLDLTTTSGSIAAAVAAALDDPDMRRAAATHQQAMLAAPSARDIGAVLAAVVAGAQASG
jgi:UDP:flavonoid glycosyltransferase YjiC (YdhE family)